MSTTSSIIQSKQSYRKTHIPKFQKPQKDESTYWSSLKTPVIINEFGSIQHVHFSPVSPYNLAVTSSTHVQIYESRTLQPTKTIARFKNFAYSGEFRNDGKVLVAGDELGLVQLFDLSSRTLLRTFKKHKGPVKVTKFIPGTSQLLSASDDTTLNIWDIPTQSLVTSFNQSEDYIRAAQPCSHNPNLILCGSYDHQFRLFDLRQNDLAMTINYEAPIEDLTIFPNGNILLIAGGPHVKVFDFLSGGKLLDQISNHQKTVTRIKLDHSGRHILTASLDQYVKIHQTEDFKVIHSIRHSSPIISLAIANEDSMIATGMTSAHLAIRSRPVSAKEALKNKQSIEDQKKSNQFWIRDIRAPVPKHNFVVNAPHNPQLTKYDRFLKAFLYDEALDAVLKKKQPESVYSVLKELIHRDGLIKAISRRNENRLEKLLAYLTNYIDDTRFNSLLIEIASIVLEMYEEELSQSKLLRKYIHTLRSKVNRAVKVQQNLFGMMGSLEMILAQIGSSSLEEKL